jgi:hypothetical protein
MKGVRMTRAGGGVGKGLEICEGLNPDYHVKT